MSRRAAWVRIAIAGALVLCGCGGGNDKNVGACVVDGTNSCYDHITVDTCQRWHSGDHFYESLTCHDLGYPK